MEACDSSKGNESFRKIAETTEGELIDVFITGLHVRNWDHARIDREDRFDRKQIRAGWPRSGSVVMTKGSRGAGERFFGVARSESRSRQTE